MADNFNIEAEKTSDGFSLRLRGEFDATSAYELVYTIRKLAHKPIRIYVDTSELKSISPFGLDVFDRAMRLSGRNSPQIVFRGNHELEFGNKG